MCFYVVSASHFLFQQASSPFRRVREEEIEVDARVADNSFEAKVGLGGAREVTVGLCTYMSAEQPRCACGVVLVGTSSTRRRMGERYQLLPECAGLCSVW